jgi:serine/threonine protein kinase
MAAMDELKRCCSNPDQLTSTSQHSTPSTVYKSPDDTSWTSSDIEPISEIDLELAENSNEVRDWDPASFQMIKHLQKAYCNFGSVVMMRCLADHQLQDKAGRGKFCAVKVMPNKWITSGPEEFKTKYPEVVEQPWKDIAMLKQLQARGCPYTCDLLGIFRDAKRTYVVTSLATKGDLLSWCDRAPRPGRSREAAMLPIVYQIADAVKCLHDVGVAHRDLSLENILLTEDGRESKVKLIDFGMASLQRHCIKQKCGKKSYQAPEMHQKETHYDTFLADIFALGVVIFGMAAGDYPWQSTKPEACKSFDYACQNGFEAFLKAKTMPDGRTLATVFSPTFAEFVGSFLEIEPDARVTLGENCWEPTRPSVWHSRWLRPKAERAGRCEKPCNMM